MANTTLRGASAWQVHLRRWCMVALTAAPFGVFAEPLPVPCAPCGAVPFAAPGVAKVMTRGNTMTVTQHPTRAVLNWQSFDIAKGKSVRFAQPSSSAIALNRIHQDSPSEIFGNLSANGQIYLINQNGIVFGRSARVDTNALVASSLDMDDAVFEKAGIVGAINDPGGPRPAFAGSGELGPVTVAPGAELKSAEGGRILLLAPEVNNGGTVTSPGGQVIAAAARDKVYLAAADGDPNLRGLLVEVENGGTVTNTGILSAPRGNVTLLGYAVNQQGLASATTSVSVNGSVRLLARDHVQLIEDKDTKANTPTALHGGVLTLGAGARTEVTPVAASTDTDAARAREADRSQREAVDSQPQIRSRIELFGNKVKVRSGASITARGGDISVKAQRNTDAAPGETVDAALTLEGGAHVDAAGSRDAVVSLARNLVSVELRGNELRDAPLQKNGPLRGKRVTFDLRKGTPLADVSGAVAGIRRSLEERLSPGGAISLDSDNGLDIARGATLDVSGGVVEYTGAILNTTKLISGGRLFDISQADPGRIYDGIFGNAEQVHRKWNVVERYQLFSSDAAIAESGYREGKDAGSLRIAAPLLNIEGDLKGGVSVDEFQRNKPGALGGFQRAFAERPLAGNLTLGRGSITFKAGEAQNYLLDDVRVEDVRVEAHAGADAHTEIDGERAELTVSPRLFANGGFDRIGIFANGRVTLPDATRLQLGAFGAFEVGAGSIDIAGDVTAPGGHIAMNAIPTVRTANVATSLTLAAGGKLDTKGQWINDRAARNLDAGIGAGPLAIDGGDVTLTVIGSLDLQAGSLIDVGAGAHKNSKGNLKPGKAGSIALSSDDVIPTRMTLAGELRGLALAGGARLTLSGGGFAIRNDDVHDANLTLLSPALFSKQGFANIEIKANRDGISVAPATRLDLRLRNLRPEASMAGAASGVDIDTLTGVGYLDAAERAPTRLALNFKRRANIPQATAAVSVGSGAQIVADAGSSIALGSDTRLYIDGLLSAPAGNISLALSRPADGNDRGFDASQAITLGPQAALLARGAVRATPNALGLRSGDVLDGGRVSVSAERGYVLTQRGSRLDVSGTSAVFDLIDPLAPAQRIATTVNGRGGEIALRAAEGMVLNGALRGSHAGSLSLTLNPLERETSADLTGLTPFPTAPRSILWGAQVPSDVAFGTAVPDAINGQLAVPRAAIAAGGFGALRLQTRPLPGGSDVDAIRFVGAQTLKVAQSLTLDTSVLASDGGTLRVAAPYVQIGNTNQDFRRSANAEAGAGSITVEAQHIDLVGDIALQGFGDRVALRSQGDVRLVGTRAPANTSTEMVGGLKASGDIAIDAARLYPSSLSTYTLTSSGADATVSLRASHRDDTLPLSAAGRLTIDAANIHHDGRLLSPLGEIVLNARDTLTLAPGSQSSVSGSGLEVPFGLTQFGREWIYPLGVVTRLIAAMPAKRITLHGADVDIARGAVVDLGGGGDLLASEHVPGPGGLKDILAAGGPSFAIVPTLGSRFAPVDPLETPAFGFAPDTIIELAASDAAPAGRFAVLPARYAVLPGALLLTRDDTAADIVPGLRGQKSDTLTLVAGRLGHAGGGVDDTAWQGYRVETGKDWRLRGEYRETRASEFFAARDRAGALPADAGDLSLAASRSLSLSGELRADPALLRADAPVLGRGAQMDISAEHLAVVERVSRRQDGVVEISASDLNHFGAPSLLLGGQRHLGDGAVVIDTAATDVTIAAGVQLELPELLAVASNKIELETGSRVTARGATVSHRAPFALAGDNALVIASSGTQPTVKHSGEAGARGTITVKTGARLFASGSIALDGSLTTGVLGSLATREGSIRLASSRVSLGDVASVSDGLALSSAALRGLSAAELILDSRSSVDVYGPLSGDFDQLVVNAAGIVGHVTGDDVASFSADRIVLGNINGRSDARADPLVAAASTLRLDAREVNIGPGNFDIAGYSALSITARQRLFGDGFASLHTAGDLSLRAGQLTTTSGARLAVHAGHTVVRDLPGDVILPGAASLGGEFALDTEDLDFAGSIVLPAGHVALTTHGARGLRMRDGARIDVAARCEVFGGKVVAVPGGRIELTAAQGNLGLDGGTVLDVSASGAGAAGTVRLGAAAGQISVSEDLQLAGRGRQRGGAWSLDANTLASTTSFSRLNAQLNAAGFDASRAFRLRQGDLKLARGAEIRAHDVSLTADHGAITIDGRIDAHGDEAGRIALNARNDVRLSGSARLDASAHGRVQRGGVVSIGSSDGRLILAATDTPAQFGIDVAGTLADSGTVLLRAPRVGSDEVAVSAADVAIGGAARIDLEAFKRYDGTDVATLFNVGRGEAQAFMGNAAAIEARLGRDTDARFHVLPGIEIDSTGNLNLNADLDLLADRFDAEPGVREAGVLTLRAARDLNINGSLSDGVAFGNFTDPASGEEFTEFEPRERVMNGPSWSYRLSAGADLDSADTGATHAGRGTLRVGAHHYVRTGTGSIDIAAAGQVLIDGDDSAIYTAGEKRGAGSFDALLTEGLMHADYLTKGGNIRIDARGGVRGFAARALPDWLARIGGLNGQLVDTVPTAWAVNVGAFKHGIGALGGGAVTITSAGSLTDLTVAVPTTGQPTRSAAGVAGVAIDGGGLLDIDVGGSIRSGVFLLGRGSARLHAAGDIVKSSAATTATVLELGDGRFDVQAGGKLTLESVFNPTLTPVAPDQSDVSFGFASPVYFSTYTPRSAVQLSALVGDVVLENRSIGIRTPYGQERDFTTGDILALTLAPASLEALSLGGDVVLNDSLILAPAARGQLSLLAADSLVTPNELTRIRLTDNDPTQIPSVAQPVDNLKDLSPDLLSDVPGIGHGDTPLHVGDGVAARIVARAGDIGAANDSRLEITLSKQALIEAGHDIINLFYAGQHVAADDHTVLHAGRDVLFSTLRNGLGVLQANQARLQFSGPGQFDVLAGHDVDLGSSDGVLSTGRARNPGLPDGPGSVTVMAGLATAPRYDAFVTRYFAKGHDYDAPLAEFVASHGGSGRGTALAQFKALPEATQRQFITRAFFNEIREGGITASKSGTSAGDYSRGFAAIDTLFAKRGIGGDIISLLSQIQTLDGGDINLLAPYGLVNAGAAALTGLDKTADQLGVVVQRSGDLNAFTAGDFLVNTSRVFALDGGSILIWSSRGNIDAGRGAKSALSIPPPLVSFDALGNVITKFPPAVAGSGIQAAVSSAGRTPGNVFLFAPGGIVDAGDAGIASAGNLTIAATAVLGADNISVGGVATGVPSGAVSVPVGLAGASAAAGSASNAAANAAAESFQDKDESPQDLGNGQVSMITVEFMGFGE